MKKYYLHDGVTQQGPFDMEELKGKNITINTNVWFDPMPGWKPAGAVDELKILFNPPVQDSGAKQFYFADNTGQHGPFKLEELKDKNITAATAVWYDPLPKWTTAGEVAALKGIISGAAVAQHTVTPSVENWNNKEFYFTENGTQQGPFKLEQLKGKNITASTPVWYDPLPKWTTAGEVAALKTIISSTPAAPHTVAPSVENWNNKEFYFTENGTQQGPFKLEQLKGKNITANTPVWYDPLPKWTTAGQVAVLKDLIGSTATIQHSVVMPTTVEDWNIKQFYYSDNAGQQGPFFLYQLKNKNITANTPVWYDPLPKWTTAGEVAALKNIIVSAAAGTHTAAAPAPTEDWNSKQYFYSDGSGQHGPYKLEQLKGKNITASTPVWYDPLPKWTTAGEVAALKDIISTPAVTDAIDWANKQYFYSDGAGQHGPLKLEELKGKNITASTPVWYDPLPKWTTAGEVAALKDIIS